VTHGHLDVYVVASADAEVGDTELPVVRDVDGQFAAMYSPDGASVFVVRPDGYLGYRGPKDDTTALIDHLQRTFAPVSG